LFYRFIAAEQISASRVCKDNCNRRKVKKMPLGNRTKLATKADPTTDSGLNVRADWSGRSNPRRYSTALKLFEPGLPESTPADKSVNPMMQNIRIGDVVFLNDGGKSVGRVRHTSGAEGSVLIIYVENAGDCKIPSAAIKNVHFGKVILDESLLDSKVRFFMTHAHDAEIR
jgi:hypothetical protein